MKRPAPDKVRFQFVTQRPRDDGCGVFVLQMLTGKTYEQIAAMIDWGVQKNHYTTWKELAGVLTELGWSIGEPHKVNNWSDVSGLAVVHVEVDHFMLYDNGIFYDPGQWEGPDLDSDSIPISYLPVRPPESGP